MKPRISLLIFSLASCVARTDNACPICDEAPQTYQCQACLAEQRTPNRDPATPAPAAGE